MRIDEGSAPLRHLGPISRCRWHYTPDMVRYRRRTGTPRDDRSRRPMAYQDGRRTPTERPCRQCILIECKVLLRNSGLGRIRN
jgi:hypothetical protein